MPNTPIITPDNDMSIRVGPIYSNPPTGTRAPVTSGTVTFFLAATAIAAVAADGTLQGNATYIGGNDDGNGGTHPVGSWLCQLDASVMVRTLLETLFGTNDEAFLICQKANDINCVTRCEYQAYRSTVIV